MYMNGSGIEPYYKKCTSSQTLALPVGVPCVVCLSSDLTVTLQGSNIAAYNYSSGGMATVRAVNRIDSYDGDLYSIIVRWV